MSTTLFVGGLNARTTVDGLRVAFAAHGAIADVKIIVDPETSRSRGFGFVVFHNVGEAEGAIAAMTGTQLDGHRLHVDVARSQNRTDDRNSR